ncbi:hypothetical protein LINPERPRIM_LOCUS37934 [Linum perenne]
MGTSKMY